MKHRWLALFTASLVTTAAAPDGAADPKDQDRLQGSWTSVSAEREGRADGSLLGHQLVIAKDTFTIRFQDKILFNGTYTLDSSQQLRTIDFKHAGHDLRGKTWLGIYKLEGDTLRICDNAGALESKRPAGFDTAPKSGRVLIVFKRNRS